MLTTGYIFGDSLGDFRTVNLVRSPFTVSTIDKALHIGMLIIWLIKFQSINADLLL